jgi:hypothetical protein
VTSKATTVYPYVLVRTDAGLERIHEDVFYDGLTSGDWRQFPLERAEREFR